MVSSPRSQTRRVRTTRRHRLPIANDVLTTIGNTPLIHIDGVYCKLEYMNPSGSIKDRAAFSVVHEAETSGLLSPGDTIVEASSGNTGISLAMVGALKGYRVIIVMPQNMSEERRVMMEALGAEVILTSGEGSLAAAIQTAEQIGTQRRCFLTRQFSNPANIRGQERMAQEIYDEIGPADAVVAGVGTGGTLMALASVMRHYNPEVKVIAVEPEESPVISGGPTAPTREHCIQGIGDGFIPDLLDLDIVDQVITVSSEAAIVMARALGRKFGLLAGISSGANMIAARQAALIYPKVVTVAPDRAERYLSLKLLG